MVYKLRHDEDLEIQKIYKEIEKSFIIKLKRFFTTILPKIAEN